MHTIKEIDGSYFHEQLRSICVATPKIDHKAWKKNKRQGVAVQKMTDGRFSIFLSSTHEPDTQYAIFNSWEELVEVFQFEFRDKVIEPISKEEAQRRATALGLAIHHV